MDTRMRLGRVFFETPNHIQKIRQDLLRGDLNGLRGEAQALRRLGEESGDSLLARLCADLETGDPTAEGARQLIGEIEGRFVALWEDVGRGGQDE